MSVDAKNEFINTINEKLSDILTVSQMKALNNVLLEEINNYEIKRVEDITYDNGEMLNMYLNAVSVEGKTCTTIRQYRYVIKRMLKKVNTPTHKITAAIMREYFASEKERGISDRTLDNERQYFNGYFGWLCREELIRKNPMKNIGTIKWDKKVKDIFSDTDIEIMKNTCKDPRDLAIITFMLSTGCRVGEIIALNKNNVDFVNFECRVFGKGKKERIVYLNEVSAMFLQNYLNGRKDNDPYLFRSKRNVRFTDEGIRKMLKRVEVRSGVYNVHPHKFRRTLATNLVKRGMPIQDVATILGHDKIETTMQYIVLDNTDIKYSYHKFKL